MFLERLTEMVRTFCIYFLHFIYLQILWLVFTLLGLGIFGAAPATVAVYRIQQRLIEEKQVVSIRGVFWQEYKQHFRQSNLLAWMLVVIGAVIYFDLQFFMASASSWSFYVSVFFYILSVWYMITVLYILPVYVHYSLSVVGCFKQALIIGMLHPFKTIVMAISLAGTIYIMLVFPQLLLTVGISLVSFIVMIFGKTAIEHVSELQQRMSSQQTVKQ
ncbi:YesL family protein [Gracilibacillus alcaliphilus]|uniref:YesL family protein n=1 Tax=Gracilibacillus alcaliphilus TaxID=1401441 RepID=UPI00195C710F|nr:DUF624 domain-containing protein [Gracilibacillus alcaliphilus]MBM7677151.1 putative membrane protein YesL [Gracilibacillus alcaliphilus]